MQMLRKLKKAVNSADAGEVRDCYFILVKSAEYFFYKKGNKMMPLKMDAHIAQKFQKLKNSSIFWDYAEKKKENCHSSMTLGQLIT